MDSSIEKEVYNDFKNALKSIDFNSYNPESTEFNKALSIGLMWKLLDEICEHAEEHEEKIEPYSDDNIYNEIQGAKKYFQKYMDSGDENYKEMSKDELKHAGILIKKAYAKLPGSEEKNKLKDYEAEITTITKQIE